MNSINKPFLVIVVIGIVFSFAGIFSDVEFIKETSMIPYYIYGRIVFGVIDTFILLLLFKKKPIDPLVIAFLINTMLYSIHGQFFVPCYYLAYIETLLVVGLFFPINKTTYRIIAIISAIIMTIVLYKGYSSYSTEAILIAKFKYDSIMAVLIMTICSIVGHSYITLTRKEKDILYNKFIDIGKNSAFILHDFKGMMSTPLLYSKLITENIKNKDFEKADKNMSKLNQDLTEIEKYAKEINKITLPNKGMKKESFKVSSTIQSIEILLSKYLDNVKLELDQDGEVITDSSLLLKILYNLTINSINEFKKNGQKDCLISVKIEENSIVFKDNGKGYPEELLKKLNSNKLTLESGTGNSGLGLQIVVGIAQELGVSLKFFNDTGAGVKITI